MILQRLGWEPRTPLREGLAVSYRWIEQEYLKTRGDGESRRAGARRKTAEVAVS
jgi:hypothetical protein